MPYEKDPRVDAYIEALPGWQQAICRRVRDLVHAVDPDVEETVKRRVQPYFVLDGNICALLAAKDHVNVFVYDGAIVADPHGLITGGHENKTARTIAIREHDSIDESALKQMLAQIVANNRAGGWRKLKPNVDLVRDWVGAINDHDLERGITLITPDFELVESTTLPAAATARGAEGFRHYAAGWERNWSDWHMREVEIVSLPPSSVVLVADLKLRGRQSGIEVERRWVYLFSLRDGKIARQVGVDDVEEARRIARSE